MTVNIQLKSNYSIQCSFFWGGDFNIAASVQDSFLFSSNDTDLKTAHTLEENFPKFFKKCDFYTEVGKEKVMLVLDYDKLAITLK